MPKTNLISSGMDLAMLLGMLFLLVFGFVILRSIAPSLFPTYFIFYFFAFVVFFIFSQLDFDVVSLFSNHFYVFSIVFLFLPVLIGQITRGTVRWISLGPLTIQPSEIVRPFLLVFFANYMTSEKLTPRRLVKGLALLVLPLFLILVQPSLGVTVLMSIGFLGVLISSAFPKKYILMFLGTVAIAVPLIFNFLAPYQRQRIETFLFPGKDPFGAGYNSIQSVIAIGSGKIWGRGLGKGVQTQLAFLPERQTDFIFASTAEELGFGGAFLILVGEIIILSRLISYADNPVNPAARAYISGLFLMLFTQTMVHVGMNLGLLPITGVPLPLVSAGGSSLLGTVLGLSIALGARKH